VLVDNSYLERLRTFLANRAVFPAEELAKHAGKWVAFTPDGTRVAASAPDPDMLEELLRASGEDPALCVIEGTPGEDGPFAETSGGAEGAA
jgi:hypothetical protein